MAVQIACAALSSTASSDTHRDIFYAWEIANAKEFPLIGPQLKGSQINGIFHLGPLWFYILSPAVWLIPNAAAITGFMGLIGSLQFPLAYRLGRKYASARCALLFVLALALPGVMAVSLVSMTHTIAVVPCLLLLALAASAYRKRPGWKHAIYLGVAGALCLNAHPTTIILFAVAVVLSVFRTKNFRFWIGHGLLVLCPVILSFAPMMVAQRQSGFADLSTSLSYAHNGLAPAGPGDAGLLLSAILYHAPQYMLNFWLDIPSRISNGLMIIYISILFMAISGLIGRLLRCVKDRPIIIGLVCVLLVQAIFTCAIRRDMPPWMAYALWPLLAALLAMGLDFISGIRTWPRFFVAAGMAFTTVWSLAIWTHMAMGRTKLVDMQAPAGKLPFQGDIRQYYKDSVSFRFPRIPFRQDFLIGKLLCEPVTLYGHYAYLSDSSFGIAALTACDSRDNVQLGGSSALGRRKLVGLREEVWKRLGIEPEQKLGVLGVAEPASVWASTTPLYPQTPYLTTFPQKIVGTVKRFVVEGYAPKEQALLISNRAHRYTAFTIIQVTANGADVAPAYQDLFTAAYRVPAEFPENEISWHIEIESVPEYVDVLTLAANTH
jgi:hypothetical protein